MNGAPKTPPRLASARRVARLRATLRSPGLALGAQAPITVKRNKTDAADAAALIEASRADDLLPVA